MSVAKVSVVVPVYNVEQYFGACLDSLINQTLQDIEIVCINDCSTDNSLSILKEYAQKDNRIKIINQEVNQGQGVGRNIAIEAATGEYIMFCDPDDWFELCACEDAYRQIKNNNNDIVFFNVYNYSENKDYGKIDSRRLSRFWGYTNEKNLRLKDIEKPFIVTGEIWYKIYKTSFLKENNIKFSNGKFGEDGQFTIGALLKADTVSVLNKVLYNYRVARQDSSSGANDIGKFELYLNEKRSNYQMIMESEDNSWILSSFIPYYIDSVLHYYKKFRHQHRKFEDKVKLYNLAQSVFKQLDADHDLSEHLGPKRFKGIKHFIKYSYIQSKFVKLFK